MPGQDCIVPRAAAQRRSKGASLSRRRCPQLRCLRSHGQRCNSGRVGLSHQRCIRWRGVSKSVGSRVLVLEILHWGRDPDRGEPARRKRAVIASPAKPVVPEDEVYLKAGLIKCVRISEVTRELP